MSDTTDELVRPSSDIGSTPPFRMDFSAGEGRSRVLLTILSTSGPGLCAFLTGGSRPHVGGVALAAPPSTIGGERLSSCDMWTLTVPGHKDAEAAAVVARALCKALGVPVSVSCGIHIDNASHEELEALVSSCKDVAAKAIKGIEATR